MAKWRLEAEADDGYGELPALSRHRRRDRAGSQGSRHSRRFFKSDSPHLKSTQVAAAGDEDEMDVAGWPRGSRQSGNMASSSSPSASFSPLPLPWQPPRRLLKQSVILSLPLLSIVATVGGVVEKRRGWWSPSPSSRICPPPGSRCLPHRAWDGQAMAGGSSGGGRSARTVARGSGRLAAARDTKAEAANSAAAAEAEAEKARREWVGWWWWQCGESSQWWRESEEARMEEEGLG
uniref:Uncharacterized protein n=1 Tax=Oryza rufipogon TaxID=4529 RepID=A0A0E0PN96_ORYRU